MASSDTEVIEKEAVTSFISLTEGKIIYRFSTLRVRHKLMTNMNRI